MADFENHHAPNASRSETGGRSHPTLESGLAALKQKNYEVAIAQLKQVAKTAKQRSTKLKAQMGLVNAYERSGKVPQAFSKCQALQSSKSSQVQDWANQKLASLRRRHPNLDSGSLGDETAGTLQTASTIQARNSTTQPDSSPDNLTGFQPFEGDTPPPNSNAYSEAGFVPLNSDASVPDVEYSESLDPISSKSDESGFVPLNESAIPGHASTNVSTDEVFSSESSPSPNTVEPPATEASPGFENPFSSLDDFAGADSDHQSGDRPITSNNSFSSDNSSSTDTLSRSAPRRTTGLKRTASPQKSPQRPTPLPSERARQWKPLKKSNALEFWLSYAWLAIALVAILTLLIRIALATAEPVQDWIERFIPVPRSYVLEDHPARVVVVGLLILLVVSPWVMRWILGQFYGVTSLSDRELERRSPETLRLLKRISQKEHFPTPKLHLLPVDAPVVFAYGHLPRTSRLVISQGILTQLSDDEIASLCAAELGHISQRDLIPMTLAVLVQQVPFLLYWGVSRWGDRQKNGVLRVMAHVVSAAAYGLFWLVRLPALWLSRTRQHQGDRHAVSMTGNPNGHTRALLNMAVGMAQAIERQRLTDVRLEGLESLMPVSYRQVLTVGSLHTKQQMLISENSETESDSEIQAQTAENSSTEPTQIPPAVALKPFLVWDAQNPHRRWLTVNNTHPPLGDRLYQLAQYALQWRIRPELELSNRPSTKGTANPFWLQVIPYAAPMLGLAAAALLWLTGGIARVANINAIEWLWGDRSLLWGCVAIGFSFGTLIRINHFFPDIKVSSARPEDALPELLESAHLIPVDSVPVKWTGKLLGRGSVANGLNQDLMLRTAHGSIKLHFLSALGPLGNLMLGKSKPSDFVGRTVTITGWFRRGATPWVDVETLKPERRATIRSGHPLWSTLLAIAATLWGAYVIYKGSF